MAELIKPKRVTGRQLIALANPGFYEASPLVLTTGRVK